MKRALITISIVIAFFGIAFYDTHLKGQHFCREYYNLPMSGVVDSVFRDKENKESPRIFLRGEGIPYTIYAYEAWQYLHPGDTLVKEVGSFRFKVNRPGTYPEYFHYNGCD
ncbi:hypothetical protein [Edaphocola flava]|uniref:hypothetical protein n=1 Tax=Edaphocola flava TaxID=2499629 RepID=UPI00100B071E|nr:hypothetical protein [Edaphocola flava]